MIIENITAEWIQFEPDRLYNFQNLDYIEKYGDVHITLKSSGNLYYVQFRSKEIRDQYFETLRRLLRTRKL